ncbi:MAG: hypothetical protein U0931_20970 [Vulcanimicrobiota bacterium]
MFDDYVIKSPNPGHQRHIKGINQTGRLSEAHRGKPRPPAQDFPHRPEQICWSAELLEEGGLQ